MRTSERAPAQAAPSDLRREPPVVEDEWARLLERERDARAEAEAMGERLRFLAEASEVLAESLDYRETLAKVAQLLVPRVADWCTIAVLDDEGAGTFRRVAVVHRDPTKRSEVEAYERSFPPEMHRSGQLVDAAASRQGVLWAEVTDAALVAAAQSPEHLRVMRELGCVSCIIVPMIARNVTVGVLSLMQSTTDRRFDEGDLTAAEALARRAAIAIDNARLYGELQAAVHGRDNFLAIAGHELRTPLSALRLTVESLLRSVAKDRALQASPRLPQRLERAMREVERLQRLTEELLDLSRITAGRLELEPESFDLALLAADVVRRLADTSSRAGSEVTLHAGDVRCVGCWDRARIDQVVTNLLTNAIKYGLGKPIELRVAREGEHALLSVHDHGIGVDVQHQRRIFERYERAVSDRHFGGLGLGLWIVRRIVEASGGTVSVESASGEGATFTARLPIAPVQAVEPVAREGAHG